MVAKIGLSFQAYLTARVAKVLASVISNAAAHGIGGYQTSGALTDQNWLNICKI